MCMNLYFSRKANSGIKSRLPGNILSLPAWNFQAAPVGTFKKSSVPAACRNPPWTSGPGKPRQMYNRQSCQCTCGRELTRWGTFSFHLVLGEISPEPKRGEDRENKFALCQETLPFCHLQHEKLLYGWNPAKEVPSKVQIMYQGFCVEARSLKMLSIHLNFISCIYCSWMPEREKKGVVNDRNRGEKIKREKTPSSQLVNLSLLCFCSPWLFSDSELNSHTWF